MSTERYRLLLRVALTVVLTPLVACGQGHGTHDAGGRGEPGETPGRRT